MFQCRLLVAASPGSERNSAAGGNSAIARLGMICFTHEGTQFDTVIFHTCFQLMKVLMDTMCWNSILLVTRFDPDYEILITSP